MKMKKYILILCLIFIASCSDRVWYRVALQEHTEFGRWAEYYGKNHEIIIYCNTMNSMRVEIHRDETRIIYPNICQETINSID